MTHNKYLLKLAFGITLLTGCATQTPTIDENSLERAATNTLSEAVYFSNLFTTCATLGGDIEVDAIDTQQNWLNENAKLVAAADAFYSQLHTNDAFSYNNKTVSPAAIRLVLDARTRATDELALPQRSPVNKQKICQFRLAQISGKALPLANNPKIAPYKAELLKHLPADYKIVDVPTLAAGLQGASQGATFYSIANAHEKTCPAAYTLSIANQWPHEVYATFCGEKATSVLTCEWGKCETKKL
ncbi:hypothetical protein [Cellvibrio sp. pealriver]|uniref:hypothetical protein n=1 Tax=Cellvibrio sp. pealriver TaxID=1622269 RepID=UPI00066FECD8|nr:hypothetical protein [Cellvibrio sp. pealriver]